MELPPYRFDKWEMCLPICLYLNKFHTRERDHLGDPGAYGRVKAKWIQKKWSAQYQQDFILVIFLYDGQFLEEIDRLRFHCYTVSNKMGRWPWTVGSSEFWRRWSYILLRFIGWFLGYLRMLFQLLKLYSIEWNRMNSFVFGKRLL
jgi:hypothetical protein